MFNWITLLCTWNTAGQLYFNKIYIFKKKEYWNEKESLLRGIFPTHGSNLGLLHCRQILYRLSHQKSAIPGLERSLGEENGNPLQYPCLENSIDRRAWRATVVELTKSWTWLNDLCFHFLLHLRLILYHLSHQGIPNVLQDIQVNKAFLLLNSDKWNFLLLETE